MRKLISSVISAILFSGLAVAAWAYEPLSALPPIPADNSLTTEKIELGKMLFFDPRVSGSNWISCATCHNPSLAFTDRLPRAFGHKMQEGPRNTPTVLNSAFLKTQFWDGRAATLEEQALGPIQAPIEMSANLEDIVTKLKGIEGYRRMFTEVFGTADPITAKNIAKAIAAFERSLITPDTPFDRYLSGDQSAISEAAKSGAEQFEKLGCAGCHTGAAFSDGTFHRIKVPGSVDEGRFNVTKKDEDKSSFRTPTLRNVELTAPYMNNGAVATLEEAVKVMGKEAISTDLTEKQVSDLIAFLKSLTGKMPKFDYPILP